MVVQQRVRGRQGYNGERSGWLGWEQATAILVAHQNKRPGVGKTPLNMQPRQAQKRPHHARFCILLSSASARKSFGRAIEKACSPALWGLFSIALATWAFPPSPPSSLCAAFLSVVPLMRACHSQSSTYLSSFLTSTCNLSDFGIHSLLFSSDWWFIFSPLTV